MATTEDSNDALWNQSVCNKSWVDIMEDEERDVLKKNSLRDSTNTKHIELRVPVKDEPILDESAVDITINNEAKEIKIQPSDVLPNFSVSHVKQQEDNSKENSKHQKNEQPKDFLQDDLSLTSHLHGFQLVSPCKVDQKTPTKTPSKGTTISHYLGKADRGAGTSSPSQVTKRKLQADDLKDSAAKDEMLMPSPSKIRRQATPVKKLQNTPKQKNTPKQSITPNFLSYTPSNHLTRKRSREITPGSSERKREIREIETDPEVIARRQKQIDYGKNTIGYDRYRQLVPKEARQKMHPKTPPIHIKFSRRAWDGMVKLWRQRLHFWDPPSEGGGDPKCLEMDEVSDASSTEGSLPPTPVQDRKRQCWQRTPGGPSKELQPKRPSHPEEDDDNQGCTPLPPE